MNSRNKNVMNFKSFHLGSKSNTPKLANSSTAKKSSTSKAKEVNQKHSTGTTPKPLSDIYSNLKGNSFVDGKNCSVSKDKNSVLLQRPDKFVPETLCKVTLNKSNNLTFSDTLPLINFVQDEARKNYFISDIKAEAVEKELKATLMAKNLEISYQPVGAPWVTYPRKVDFTLKKQYKFLQTDLDEYSRVAINLFSDMKEFLAYVEKNPNTFFEHSDMKPVNKDKIVY